MRTLAEATERPSLLASPIAILEVAFAALDGMTRATTNRSEAALAATARLIDAVDEPYRAALRGVARQVSVALDAQQDLIRCTSSADVLEASRQFSGRAKHAFDETGAELWRAYAILAERVSGALVASMVLGATREPDGPLAP